MRLRPNDAVLLPWPTPPTPTRPPSPVDGWRGLRAGVSCAEAPCQKAMSRQSRAFPSANRPRRH